MMVCAVTAMLGPHARTPGQHLLPRRACLRQGPTYLSTRAIAQASGLISFLPKTFRPRTSCPKSFGFCRLSVLVICDAKVRADVCPAIRTRRFTAVGFGVPSGLKPAGAFGSWFDR